jgi:hypothetical protein
MVDCIHFLYPRSFDTVAIPHSNRALLWSSVRVDSFPPSRSVSQNNLIESSSRFNLHSRPGHRCAHRERGVGVWHLSRWAESGGTSFTSLGKRSESLRSRLQRPLQRRPSSSADMSSRAESGAGDETIMEIAGHVDRQMLRHYSHIRMKAKRAALDSALASRSAGRGRSAAEE